MKQMSKRYETNETRKVVKRRGQKEQLKQGVEQKQIYILQQ